MPPFRITQQSVEVLLQETGTGPRVSQQSVEVLLQETGTGPRVSQITTEVMYRLTIIRGIRVKPSQPLFSISQFGGGNTTRILPLIKFAT